MQKKKTSEDIARFLSPERPLDCNEGRRLGCATFCCSLIVRLRAGEQDPGNRPRQGKSCVDKDPDTGHCIYLDPSSGYCSVYDRRPAICREYDCRTDPLLQTVLENGFHSLTQLVKPSGSEN